MARTKLQKKEIMGQIENIIKDSSSLVFVNFHGLKVAESTEMRRKLRSEGVGFFIAKKTLTKKVLTDKKFKGEIPELVGELGLAYGKDAVAPARGVYEFQKKFKDQVSILGGIFENGYMTKTEMLSIASIPPVKTLYGMFVNVINSPIQGIVIALDQIAKKKV